MDTIYVYLRQIEVLAIPKNLRYHRKEINCKGVLKFY